MDELERLAALKNAQRLIEEQIREIRDKTDTELLKRYESDGVDRVRLRIHNGYAGIYEVVASKDSFDLLTPDDVAYLQELEDEGMSDLTETAPKKDWQERLVKTGLFEISGETVVNPETGEVYPWLQVKHPAPIVKLTGLTKKQGGPQEALKHLLYDEKAKLLEGK